MTKQALSKLLGEETIDTSHLSFDPIARFNQWLDGDDTTYEDRRPYLLNYTTHGRNRVMVQLSYSGSIAGSHLIYRNGVEQNILGTTELILDRLGYSYSSGRILPFSFRSLDERNANYIERTYSIEVDGDFNRNNDDLVLALRCSVADRLILVQHNIPAQNVIVSFHE